MKIIPSKYAQPLFTEEFFEADMWGGRGRGGSHNITLHALFSMLTATYFRGYFVRAVHGHIRDSLWQDFKDRIDEVGELNKINLKKDFSLREDTMKAIYLPNGHTIRSKGFKAQKKSNTAQMKSLANATHIYGEEWEEVGQEESNKLMDSIRTTKAPIRIIRSWNSPPKDHWLVRDYFNLVQSEYDGYYRLEPKGIKNHLSVFGTYKDNIKNINPNTAARYERYKETSPKYYYNQILGLVSDGGDRKVYYGWRKITFAEYMNLDAPEVYGLDFGDVAPTSLVRVKYKDGCFYRHLVTYESMRSMAITYDYNSSTDSDKTWEKHKGLLTHVFKLLGVNKETPMFCDPAQKGLIIELRSAGFKAVAARKDKASNINFINRAVNYYTDTSTQMEDEYNGYYLQEDINKQPIDGKPQKSNDHSMDAQEYACRGLKDLLKINL